MSRRERLEQLRKVASQLESGPARRAEALQKVAEHGESFLQDLQNRPVYSAPGDRQASLDAFGIDSGPSSLDDALKILDTNVERVGHNLGSSRFFAYIPSGGLYESALADYIAAVTNRYSGVGYASPGSARMEEVLLGWLAKMVGYPDTADGDLTSGGSMAAVSAVVAAREYFGVNASNIENHVVYLTTQTHHTFRKALHVAGVGQCVIRRIAMDDRFRMRADLLEEAVQEDKEKGLTPWIISASAGTTDVGAVDPLDAIADVSEGANAWMHVDAAYGGAFALCEEGRTVLSGLSRTDSLILDPHKGFFLPCGVGALLVRDGKRLFDAYHARGTYMQDMQHDTERSPCDYSPELTRPFRALRFWLPFKMFGTAPFEAALEEKLLLARYFHDEAAAIPGVEVGPRPDLSIATFRYVPEDGNADAFNSRLVDRIREDGRVFLTSTTMNDQFTLRMAILGYNTHLEDVDTALQVIAELIVDIAEEQRNA